MDARGDLALRVSGGLEQLSCGSCLRGYLYTFTSPAPPGSRLLAAHARPGAAAGGYPQTFISPELAELRLAAHARLGALAAIH